MSEKIIIPLEASVDKKSFSDASRELQKFATDNGKALDTKKVKEFEDRWASLKKEKEAVRKELNRIKALGKTEILPKNQLRNAEIAFRNISKETADAGRALDKYKQKGDEVKGRFA
jgi:hypothetical protein